MNLPIFRVAGFVVACFTFPAFAVPASVAAQQPASAGVGDASELANQLRTGDPEARWRAAEKLGQLGSQARSEVPALLDALDDGQPLVRQQAAKALGLIGDDSEKVVKALMETVGDEQTGIRLTAVAALRRLVSDPGRLVPFAADLLAQEDQLLASRAVETVILRGEKAMPFLIEALKNERSAYWACLAIEEMGEVASPTVPALTKLLSETDSESLRVQALLALAATGSAGKQAKQEVLAALRPSAKPEVQSAAAYAAGMLGLKDASERLQATSQIDDPLLSMISTWALAKLSPDDQEKMRAAVDKLVRGLSSDDATIRLTAAKGIELLNPDPALVMKDLALILDEGDPVVALNIADAIASLGEPVAQRVAEQLDEDELRWLAVEVLRRLGPEAGPAVPEIIAALRGASDEYRERLQEAVRAIGAPAAAATTELVRSLDSDEEDVRHTALLAIGSIGTGASASQPALLALMESTDDEFERTLAAWALAHAAPEDDEAASAAVPVLIKALDHDDLPIQLGAADVLGQLGTRARPAVDKLKSIATDEDAPEALKEVAGRAAKSIQQSED